MMVVIALQDGQMSLMPEGCTPLQAAELCEKAAVAIRNKVAAESGPPLYLPNGHGKLPPLPPPGGMQ